jgi:hypothetical protein
MKVLDSDANAPPRIRVRFAGHTLGIATRHFHESRIFLPWLQTNRELVGECVSVDHVKGGLPTHLRD